jgi:NADPH-dependent ferric siderophore reductase
MTTAPTRRPVPEELFGGRLKGCYLLDLEVLGVVDRSPRVRTVTFTSPDLIGFTWQPGQDLMLEVPTADRSVRRRYTIRRADPVAGTLDIDVVLHGTGPFARWATSAAVGDRIDGIGPRGVVTVRADATNHLFVGDESSMAFAFAMVEALPAGTTATVLLTSEAEPPDVAGPESAAHVELAWVRASDVIDRLRTLPLPDGTVAYLNGERTLVRQAADLLATRGLAPDSIEAKAYWRRDQPNAPHGEPAKD